jgi:iron complex outermembrane receptor protein
MGMTMMRSKGAATLTAWVFMIGYGIANAQSLSREVDFNIASQRLASAIVQFSEQAHVQVISSGIDVTDQTTAGVSGRLTVAEALNTLLKGTGLRYKAMNENTVSLQVVKTSHESSQTSSTPLSSLALAQADVTQNPRSTAGSTLLSGSETDRSNLNEIIVTAQKKSERLQDVPVPVTVIAAEALLDSNQVSVQDYYTRIPGLNVTPTGFGGPQVTIRGVTTGGFANPTVGVVVDDVPYGSSTNIGGLGSIVPDIDPSDLARVEVLRGPQGTLYGASAMGGLLKFVTIDPSTDAVFGHVQAGTSSTYNGGGMGYSVRGTVNIPVTDTLAFLASGFSRRDPGYVDDVQTGQEDVNSLRVDGGRVAALWRPVSDVSVKLSAMLQHARSDGSDDIDPSLEDLEQSKLVNTGGFDKKIQVYTATVTAKLADIDITSVSGYNINNFYFSSDYSPLYSSYADTGIPGSGFNGFGVAGAPIFEQNKTDKFTQEIRLSGVIAQRIDWLAGGFYTHENSRADQQLLGENPTTGALVGTLFTSAIPSTLSEYAGFGDLTFRVTDQFDVQVGGRESFIRQTQSGLSTGPLAGGESLTPEVETNANDFTYLLTPRYKLSPNLMVYARLASGYRAGGPNPNITLLSLPHSFDPDKTENYEIGVKGDTLEHRLSFDASVYYIDWRDIQLQVLNGGFLYYTNGGRAKSQGLELSAEAKPLDGLTVAAWVAWNDAELKDALPPGSAAIGVYGLAGDRLPDSSRFSGSVSVDDEFHLTGNVTGFIGATVSYQSERLGNFVGAPPAQRDVFPAYARTDARAGVKYDTWTANLFANNVADKRGVLAEEVTPNNFLYIRPRTIGINIAKSF